MTPAKTSSDAAVLAALGSRGKATTADLAAATGLARSTVARALARLEQAGRVRRHAGGREPGRRLPDRWTVATPSDRARRRRRGKRLRPGELDGLVLDYLTKQASSGR